MMSQSVLETALSALNPASTEAEAIDTLSSAYATYASDAEAVLNPTTAVPILPTAVEAGRAAMAASLVGMSTENAGLTKIPTAILAFWTAAAALGPLCFSGATVVTPPPHASLPTLFPIEAAANVSEERNKDEALSALAGIMHDNATLGGTATIATLTYAIQ